MPSTKPRAGVVGQLELAHRLLRAVGGQRREMEFIADHVGEWRAIGGAGRREDQPRPVAVADGTDRLEQREHAVEIAAIALLEVELSLGGHDARSVKDELRAPGDEARRSTRCRSTTISVVPENVGFAGATTSVSVSRVIALPLSKPAASRPISLKSIMPAAPVTRICMSRRLSSSPRRRPAPRKRVYQPAVAWPVAAASAAARFLMTSAAVIPWRAASQAGSL
jgi:hypothetical protein